MNKASPRILTINGGSSSIKFSLFEVTGSLRRIYEGAIERIGQSDSALHVKGLSTADNFSQEVKVANHSVAISVLLDWLQKQHDSETISAVGHRIVHGGPKYNEAQKITPEMVAELQRISPFDPQHLPDEIKLIKAFQNRFPNLVQIACFDTAFHHNLPRVAQIMPIPRRYEAQGVRRYGFHGLSYAFLMEELVRTDGPEAARGRVILAHLGNGASLAAVHNGQPVDTSMGFTPTSGLVMGTRSGDVDPGLVSYLALTENMNTKQFAEMINFQSGLLGISETTSDMQVLLDSEKRDVRAAEAVAAFCYQGKKFIGSLAAALGGLDQLVFAGGIGENASVVRARICCGLEFLGVELNQQCNEAHAPLISSDFSRVKVRVIHTDEEIMIARAAMGFLDRD